MSSRTATVDWRGSLVHGAGAIELTSSGRATFEYSLATRAAEASAVTSPEELLAAAYASCYAMQLAALLDPGPDESPHLHVQAAVTQGGPEVDFGIVAIALTVRGSHLAGTEGEFIATARDAAARCPVGRALSSVPVTVDAQLAA